MAPSDKNIAAAIARAVETLFADPELRETLTVRTARTKAEEGLGLDAGFLSTGKWKDRSKKSIRELVESLEEAESGPDSVVTSPKAERKKSAPVPTKAEPAEKGAKRGAAEPKAQSTKRQKKQHTPTEDETSELTDLSSEENGVSSLGDSDRSDAPKKRKGFKAKVKAAASKKAKSKTKVKSAEDELENDEPPDITTRHTEDSDSPRKKSQAKPKSKTPAKRQSKSDAEVRGRDESEGQDSDAPVPPKKTKATPNKKTTKAVPKKSARGTANSDTDSHDEKPAPESVSTHKKETKDPSITTPLPDAKNTTLEPRPETGAGSESDESIVLDPSPKPKRQRVPQGEKKAKKPNAPKEPKASKSKAAALAKELSPAETQIKTLQAQLRKCGMKNIWQFEMKKYGDDSNAKIKHLQDALKEIGMVGRFSEQRAKEIKEQRELLADVEEVTAMDGRWGLNSGRRGRGAAPKKSFKATGEDDAESEEGGGKDRGNSNGKSDGQDEDGSESDEQPAARRPRARAELAFLADEEDSDE